MGLKLNYSNLNFLNHLLQINQSTKIYLHNTCKVKIKE